MPETSAATGQKLKVFVSYSRRDSDGADTLVDALTEHGFDVTIDRRNLEFGERAAGS
jgi:TIR domain